MEIAGSSFRQVLNSLHIKAGQVQYKAAGHRIEPRLVVDQFEGLAAAMMTDAITHAAVMEKIPGVSLGTEVRIDSPPYSDAGVDADLAYMAAVGGLSEAMAKVESGRPYDFTEATSIVHEALSAVEPDAKAYQTRRDSLA
jgi:hypothetical protein